MVIYSQGDWLLRFGGRGRLLGVWLATYDASRVGLVTWTLESESETSRVKACVFVRFHKKCTQFRQQQHLPALWRKVKAT